MKHSLASIHLGTFLALCAQHVVAGGQIDDEAGWGIKLYLNFGYSSSQSQFDTDGDNAVTSNLDSRGEKIKKTKLFPLVSVDYTLSNLKTQFFLGQAKDNIIRGQSQFEVGVSHMLGEKEFVEVAYSPEVASFNNTWQDPYVAGAARQKTDQSTRGVRVRWGYAMDSPLTLRYAFVSSDIDDELSGEFLGLSRSQRSKLDRNGNYHRLSGEYLVFSNDSSEIAPILSYTRGDTDGRAMGYDGYRIGLQGRHRIRQRHLASIFLDYEHKKYLQSNPIFNERQKDDVFGITAAYTYLEPFNWKRTRVIALAKYDRSTSNITFYETEGAGVSIGLGWEY